MYRFANLPAHLGSFALAFVWVVSVADSAVAQDTGDKVADEKVSVLLIDGQNNHQWQETTPVIKSTLESCGLFKVDVATSPPPGGDMASFSPDFSTYDVVVSNYNGEPWNDATKKAFESFVASGKGFVSVHAADNSFPDWAAYNQMIGLGGWGGRDASDGPYVRWKDDLKRFTRDASAGGGGTHGKRIPFVVVVRDRDHPITRGLPGSFMQTADELYGKLRGPALNMHVLATGFSTAESGGTGEHEPLLMSIGYGSGRVFHTTLGHDVEAMKGLAFQVTLQRGTEWAATGKVTLPPVEAETLTNDKAAIREPDQVKASQSEARSDGIADINAEGWVSMLNGKNLSGWSVKNGTATYRHENGIIKGKTAEGSPSSYLCSEKTYRDFELTFEVMFDIELNSGVQIRSIANPALKTGSIQGPQIETEKTPGESGYIYGQGTGRQWITKERPIVDAIENEQWNRYVIRAKGDRMQTWINGRAVADVVDPESNREGFIGLQVHSVPKNSPTMTVQWRDLRIREL